VPFAGVVRHPVEVLFAGLVRHLVEVPFAGVVWHPVEVLFAGLVRYPVELLVLVEVLSGLLLVIQMLEQRLNIKLGLYSYTDSSCL